MCSRAGVYIHCKTATSPSIQGMVGKPFQKLETFIHFRRKEAAAAAEEEEEGEEEEETKEAKEGKEKGEEETKR